MLHTHKGILYYRRSLYNEPPGNYPEDVMVHGGEIIIVLENGEGDIPELIKDLEWYIQNGTGTSMQAVVNYEVIGVNTVKVFVHK